MALRISRAYKEFVPIWGGNDKQQLEERISLSYKTLTVEDMFIVQRATQVNVFVGIEINAQDNGSIEKYWSLMKYVLQNYTKDYKNIIVDGSGCETPDRVIEVCQVNHMPLLSEVFNHVINQSVGTVEQEKNSEAESALENSDSALTVQPV